MVGLAFLIREGLHENAHHGAENNTAKEFECD